MNRLSPETYAPGDCRAYHGIPDEAEQGIGLGNQNIG